MVKSTNTVAGYQQSFATTIQKSVLKINRPTYLLWYMIFKTSLNLEEEYLPLESDFQQGN
jgi:hypothetical protein